MLPVGMVDTIPFKIKVGTQGVDIIPGKRNRDWNIQVFVLYVVVGDEDDDIIVLKSIKGVDKIFSVRVKRLNWTI